MVDYIEDAMPRTQPLLLTGISTVLSAAPEELGSPYLNHIREAQRPSSNSFSLSARGGRAIVSISHGGRGSSKTRRATS